MTAAAVDGDEHRHGRDRQRPRAAVRCWTPTATWRPRPGPAGMVAVVLAAQDPDDSEGSLGRLARDRRRPRLRPAVRRHGPADGRRTTWRTTATPQRPSSRWRPGWRSSTTRTGPGSTAMMHTVAGSLHAQLGNRAEAAEPRPGRHPDPGRARGQRRRHPGPVAARRGRDRRGPVRRGRAVDRGDRRGSTTSTRRFGGAFVTATVRAELALARGRGRRGAAPLPAWPSVELNGDLRCPAWR